MGQNLRFVEIVLDPNDLYDKWGLGDGDAAFDPLIIWALENWPATDLGYHDAADELPSYLSHRVLLAEAVTTRLIPTLDPEDAKRIFTAPTLHNPWRIEEDSYNGLRKNLGKPIAIQRRDVWAMCEKVFPPRGPGWVAMYETLSWQSQLLAEVTSDRLAEDWCKTHGVNDRRVTRHQLITGTVDTYAKKVSDDVLLLAAGLIDEPADGVRIPENVPALITAAYESIEGGRIALPPLWQAAEQGAKTQNRQVEVPVKTTKRSHRARNAG